MNWNPGGWFGGQIGATAWMLVAAILTFFQDFSAGIVVLALFVIPNVIGLALWFSRRLSCYASTQILIGVSGVCGLATVYVLKQSGTWAQIQTGARVSATYTYWLIALVFVGLMLMFHLRFGRGGKGPEN